MAIAHVRTELVEVPEADSRLMVICMDHVTSLAVNIIDVEMGLALGRALLEAEWYIENELINGLVICSGKHQSFLAGADILFEQKLMNKARAFSAVHGLASIICKLESLDVPSFAVVNGAALGGGLELIIGCDFRVADEKHCTQLGLPEVKLGVLPGAGGCMRLPHVIGLSMSLDLLLTGKQVDAKKALKCGLVDQLFSATQIIRLDDNTSDSYQYQWLPELTACLKARKIGRHKFILKQIRKDASCLEVPDFSQLTEDSIEKYIDWSKCNAKYLKKFPIPLFRNNWLEQQVTYWFAQRSIFKQVGKRMPSPYKCLHTTMACLNAENCHEAVKINSHSFAELVLTAESKCLMGLFLESRHAKKTALSYGQPCLTLSKENTVIIILFNHIRRSESRQAACFAQCAIHSGFHVVFTYDQHDQPSIEDVSTIVSIIDDQFSYLVRKKRITFKEVSDKLDQLLSFHSIEKIVGGDIGDVDVVFVVDLKMFACDDVPGETEQEFNCTSVRKTLQSNLTKSKVVCVVSYAGLGGDSDEGSVVNINTFFPLDRLSTMVEVFSSNPQDVLDDMSAVTALINAMGKIPINAAPEQGLSVTNFMLISFWSRVVRFFCSDQNMKLDICKIDKIIGFSPGPFQVMDQIGLPYVLRLAQQAQSTGYDCDHLLQLLRPLVTAGNNGKLCGRGFYVWNEDKPVTSSGALGATEHVFIGMKLSLLAAVETSKRAPNVDNSLLDLICVSGPMNFPPQEGGPFHYFYRNPKLFASITDDDLAVVPDPDAAYSSTTLVKEVQEMGPCYGTSPLPMMVPGYTPSISLMVTLVIVVFALVFTFLL